LKNIFLYCRGGRYAEEDAKFIVVQILSVVAFCHLQGVVHRDLKPEVFLLRFITNYFTHDSSILFLSDYNGSSFFFFFLFPSLFSFGFMFKSFNLFLIVTDISSSCLTNRISFSLLEVKMLT
jgi:serine/threonine protein kinase